MELILRNFFDQKSKSWSKRVVYKVFFCGYPYFKDAQEILCQKYIYQECYNTKLTPGLTTYLLSALSFTLRLCVKYKFKPLIISSTANPLYPNKKAISSSLSSLIKPVSSPTRSSASFFFLFCKMMIFSSIVCLQIIL